MESSSGRFWMITTFILLIMVLAGVWMFVLNPRTTTPSSVNRDKGTPTSTAKKSVTKEATPGDETKSGTPGIKNYTNSKPVYTFLYPQDWKIDSTKAVDKGQSEGLELTFEKKSHTFRAYQPPAYGGMKCEYGTVATPTETEIGRTVFAKYVEVKAGTRVFRRPTEPRVGSDNKQVFDVCLKNSKGDFTITTPVGLITYEAPATIDEVLLKEMDTILSGLSASEVTTDGITY